MLLPIAICLGLLVGWQRAVRRGGDRFDRLQYAAVHGILFGLIAIVGAIFAQRLGLI